MSDDLVKRLRSAANVFYEYAADDGAFLREAADEIERLRDALELMRDLLAGQRSPVAVAFLAIIRATLSDKGEKP